MSGGQQVRPAEPAATQLALLEAEQAPWRLDPHTREIGRKGVAEARAALRGADAGGSSRPVSSRAA